MEAASISLITALFASQWVMDGGRRIFSFSMTMMQKFLVGLIRASLLSFSPGTNITKSINSNSISSGTLNRTIAMTIEAQQQAKSKRILFIRHGQAEHNPRAEAAREDGCSYEKFLSLMKEDDSLDSKLTDKGEVQARQGREMYQRHLQGVQLVVSSPLSRALRTADLIACPEEGITISPISGEDQKEEGHNQRKHFPSRICIEDFREINGWLLNAKRRQRRDLQKMFHSSWSFDLISEHDEYWTNELESQANCAERGYKALLWLKDRDEDKIMVVSHGGILRFCMLDHPNVVVIDGRPDDEKRFGNCELREYDMTWEHDDSDGVEGSDKRPLVTLTEVKS